MSGFGKITGKVNYFKYNECTPNQRLVTNGKYMGAIVENKFNADRPGHKFFLEDGGTTCLKAAGHLDYLLEANVSIGDRVSVNYEGSEVLSGGTFKGKPAHKFSLEDLQPGDKSAPVVAAPVGPASEDDITL